MQSDLPVGKGLMRIVFYKDNLATGRGADKAVCSLASELCRRGYDTTIVTGLGDVAFSFPVGSGVVVEHRDRRDVRDFARSYDICIAAGPNEIMDLTCGGRLRPPTKTIVELLVYPKGFFKWKHPIRNHRLKKALGLADIVQIQIAGYADSLKPFVDPKRIVVIGNWADVCEPPNEKGESKVILCPAAINKSKNQLLLVKAFAHIVANYPGWELHLYGKAVTKYGEKCRAAAGSWLKEKRIRFFEFTSDLPSVYASAAFMAYPSLLEGFPLAMIEGMRYRLPVVAVASLPGVRDMVLDGETGIVAEPSVEAYSAALARLMADDALRVRMGENARVFCLNRYSREGVLAQWEALFRRVVGERFEQGMVR